MIIKKHAKKNRFNYWPAMLIGLVCTLLVAWVLNFQNEYQIKLYTNTLADNTEKLIAERFQHFEYGLRGARGTIVAVGTENVTRKQFENYIYSRNIEQEFPGAIGFGFIRRVSPSQQSTFLENARKDGAPDFNIRFLAPHDNDRFVIQYIYPLDKNRQAVGLDIGSEINRRSAAISAARDDAPYLTAPITLVQANRKPRKGALVLLPIYADGALLNTDDAREKAVVGWSYAPLVIDEVLDGLGILNDHAYISLTNKTENEPFYRSTSTVLGHSATHRVVRDIFILGQHWKMEISPSNQMLNKTKHWNIGLAIIICLVITLITLATINMFRVNRLTEDQSRYEKIYQLSSQSLFIFFATPRLKQTHKLILILFILIFSVSSWLIVKNSFTEINSELSETRESVLSELQNVVNKYRQDVLFLASSSAIRTLEKLETNIRPEALEQHSDSVQHWNERLADIFEAYMLSNEDVYQVRFIEAKDNWRERVKIQRFADELTVMDDDFLQSKANETYIEQTLQVGEGNVFVSDMTLNREYGKIERPHRPMWRFSSPVFFANGDLFGIVIINVDANNILQFFKNNISTKTDLYITNNEGQFLLHPNKSKTFTFEYGNIHRWQDEFHSLPFFEYIRVADVISYSGITGNVFAKQGVFALQDKADGRLFNIYSATSQFPVFKKIAIQMGITIGILLLVSLLNIAIQYWLWLNDIITQKETLNTQREEQRSKESQRFKGLLESAPDATIVIDEQAIIQMVNVQAEQLFGYKRAELENQSIEKLIPRQKRETYTTQLMNYIQQPERDIVSSRVKVLARDIYGRAFPAEVNFSYADLDGTLLVNISVCDITERLEQEEKLNIALRDAESATEAKSAFLANTSHEIRTPLNAIIGLGYLLAEEQLTEEQQQLVAKIQISGKSLLGIVNDVLDLAKIEAKEMQLDLRPIDMWDFFEEIALVFTSQAEEKGLVFNLQIDTDLPERVIADSTRLQQIVANLLSNALKFTTQGTVSLNVQRTPITALPITDLQNVSDEYIGIRLSVTDTGIGIPQEVQARLFKPFVQADSGTARQYGGTGLGLSIVYQLVDLMGGRLGVESGKNSNNSASIGSKFWVELPLKMQTSQDMVEQAAHTQKLFVLIAEDKTANKSSLQQMTQALGWRSQIVSNTDELADVYISRKNNKLRPPDVMILNWELSQSDSLTAIRSVATQIGSENLSAILLVSSNPQDHSFLDSNLKGDYLQGTHLQSTHFQEKYAQGQVIQGKSMVDDPEQFITGFLLEPINSSSLFNAVNDAVTYYSGNSKRVLESTRTEAVDAKWLPDMQILVVDDHAINLMVISNILEKNGAHVQKASSGEEALSILEQAPNEFDAVLMDIQMPGIDGLETTRRIRNNLGLISLPVIALTAGALVEERNRAFEAGMNDFITKPITPSEVINVLRELVAVYRNKQVSILSPTTEPMPELDVWPKITDLDIDRAKEMLLDDKSLFFRTLDTLLSDYTDLATAPKPEIDRDNSVDLRSEIASQVHKLRSVSGTVGAQKIQKLAEQAENALRTETKPAYEILVELSTELKKLYENSAEALEMWADEQRDMEDILAKNDVVPLHIETVSHILTLLEMQDMGALEEFNQHSASFRDALDDDNFFELQDSLIKLNYKKAIAILASLQKNMMAI
ncbi:CHASE domain-containing protein [Vibrio sp. MA40-2]|uniref:CHASE domain-containing protein n=1 Tax=Vibrio sp. MA40-2 TaxID=3391828 RepID=UPI0039A64343